MVSVKTTYPKRVRVIRSAFQPWAEPTPEQAHRIVEIEAAREGISQAGLESRIRCESGWKWDNEFPVYHAIKSDGHYGLGQFMVETFGRGMSTIGSRRVELHSRSERPAKAETVVTYSDGTTKVRRWRVRQVILHIMRGMIPRDPPLEHGWAQVRIMAEALAGRSAVSNGEWSCSA